MMQKICPVCDQVMKSAHYCRNCKRWVKDPWVREAGCYLNERHPQNERNCSYHGTGWDRSRQGQGGISVYTGAPGRDPRQPAPARRELSRSWERRQSGPEKNKTGRVILVLIFAYLIIQFVVAGIGYLGSSKRSVFIEESDYGGYEDGYDEDYFSGSDGSVYHELEDAEVIERGEACRCRGHFDLSGAGLQQPLQDILEEQGFVITGGYTSSRNEVYDNGDSWFDTVISMDIADEESEAYQYADINFDTATGALHEVDMMIEDGSRAAKLAVALLKYMEEKGAIWQDMSYLEEASSVLDSLTASGDSGTYVYGEVEISIYAHSDAYGIYISHSGY